MNCQIVADGFGFDKHSHLIFLSVVPIQSIIIKCLVIL